MFGLHQKTLAAIRGKHAKLFEQRAGQIIEISGWGDWLVINEPERMFEFGKIGKTAPLPFGRLISAEVVRDGAAITKADVGATLLGAGIGGLLLGGAGAIVGGSAASRSTVRNISALSIRVTIDDFAEPVREMRFILPLNRKGMDPAFLKEQIAECERAFGLLQVVLRRSSVSSAPPTSVSAAITDGGRAEPLMDMRPATTAALSAPQTTKAAEAQLVGITGVPLDRPRPGSAPKPKARKPWIKILLCSYLILSVVVVWAVWHRQHERGIHASPTATAKPAALRSRSYTRHDQSPS